MDVLSSYVGNKPVVIFSKSSCGMCHTIKTLISSFGANSAVYELDQMPEGKRLEEALMLAMGPQRPPPRSVPAVFIGQTYVGGAREVMSLHLTGDLSQKLIAAGAIFIWQKKRA